jgi:hypothetical protein
MYRIMSSDKKVNKLYKKQNYVFFFKAQKINEITSSFKMVLSRNIPFNQLQYTQQIFYAYLVYA